MVDRCIRPKPMPIIELLPAVQELDARIRGRLIYQVCSRLEFYTEGSFIFAGWIVSFDSDGVTVTIGLQEYFL
jgi:hypothetical protein